MAFSSSYSKYTEKQPIRDKEYGYFAQNKHCSTNGIFFFNIQQKMCMHACKKYKKKIMNDF